MPQRPSRRRVVVTGIGIVSSAGLGEDPFWDLLVSPDRGRVRGAVPDGTSDPFLDRRDRARSDPFTRHAVAAAQMAWDDAGAPAVDPDRAGVVMGTVYGALESLEHEAERFRLDGPDEVSPFLGALACENAGASMVALRFGLRGPAKSVVGACASGAYAIADAADLIRAGRADVVVAGASQGRITPSMLASYANLRVLSDSGWLRPFDRRRDGFVFAEGGAVVVLESEVHATGRGARLRGEVLGASNTNDASSMTSPSGAGAVSAMHLALADAGLTPDHVGHVNAHGTGTMLNDLREAEALVEVFGKSTPPVTSTKAAIGHAAGASGAFEAVASLLSIERGLIPPTHADHEPDPAIQLDLVFGPPRPWAPAPVLSNSFGLGGHNGCLVLGPS